MLGDGWESICDYNEIHDTANWMPRRRYMLRLLCHTEYNTETNTDYNTESNAMPVSMLHYWDYARIDSDSESVIPSYSTTMTIEDCNPLPNQALPIDVAYKAMWDESPAGQRHLEKGDDNTAVATATAKFHPNGGTPGHDSTTGLRERQ